MKLSVKIVGVAGWSVIGDDQGGDLITGWLPRMDGVPQVDNLAFSKTKFVVDRGNQSWSMTGTVVKTHADAKSALAFIRTHAAALSGGVHLKVEEGTEAGYLAGASMTQFVPVLTGCTTTITYSFVGATYNATAPTT